MDDKQGVNSDQNVHPTKDQTIYKFIIKQNDKIIKVFKDEINILRKEFNGQNKELRGDIKTIHYMIMGGMGTAALAAISAISSLCLKKPQCIYSAIKAMKTYQDITPKHI